MAFSDIQPVNQSILFDAYGEAIGTTTVSGATRALQVDVAQSVPLTTTVSSGGYGGQVEGRAAAGVATVGNPVYVGGTDGSYARGILTDSAGRIVIAPSSSPSQTKGFADGHVILSATTVVPIRETTYTEQSSNAQRSIVSASANDTSAGTGARTVKITYYTSTFAGPYTETITMNGTSAVNTVATDICYVEFMEVITAGSGGSNAGIISLKATTGGGGATVWSIAAASNKTFGAHHYVATGKTCYITGFWAGIKGADTTSAYLFIRDLNTANSVDKQISDTLRVPSSGQSFRFFDTPMTIPAGYRITAMSAPDSTSSRTYFGSFDFYEE